MQPASLSRVSPHAKCLLTELDDGSAVILHLDTKFYYTLNETAVSVWKALSAGASSADEIAARLAREFVVDLATAQRDTERALELMRNEGLVQVAV